MLSFLASIIFVFGPSCGGKSTLSKALIQELGSSWSSLDRDDLIENNFCTDEKADELIEKSILSFQEKNRHLVIDAQIPWRAPRRENELYLLVYAPLSELLLRDAKRTILLQRPEKKAYYARLYVEETFAKVFEIPLNLGFHYDLVLNSSQYSIQWEIQEVLKLLSQSELCISSIDILSFLKEGDSYGVQLTTN
jgi:cytidylate kinase